MNSLNYNEIGHRIKQLRKEKGLSQTAFADRIWRDVSTISKLEAGKLELSNSIRLAICDVLGVKSEWLLFGRGPMYEDKWVLLEERAKELGEDVYTRLSGKKAGEEAEFPRLPVSMLRGNGQPAPLEKGGTEGQPPQSPPYTRGGLGGGYVFVPQVRGEISAGRGLTPDDTAEVRLAFRKDWIERKGDPANMSLVRVSGDSMEPTLKSGDIVLVDHNRNYIDPQGGIYAVSIDDGIIIKRVQVLYPSGRFKIISDNSRYEPFDLESERLKVNGRVVWFGREI